MAARRLSPALVAGVVFAALACADAPSAPDVTTDAIAAGVDLETVPRPSLGLVSGGRYWDGFNFLVSTNGPWGTPINPWPMHLPTAWKPTDFDVAIHSRDPETWYTPEPFRAMHGMGCQPFQENEPDNSVRQGDLGSHDVHTYADLNYRCRNHMMTAIKSSGYGLIYLTPNAMVDWLTGEASVKFALSTLRTSRRDWVDLWLTPYDDNLVLPLDAHLPDLQGPPREALHIRMADEPKERTRFEAYYVQNFNATKMGVVTTNGYESILKPVSTRRDTFELRISRYRVRFGMKKLASPNEGAGSIEWIDLPLRLPFSRAVVQFGHHSFNPAFDGGTPDTWHWDDFTIAPAVPFTIIRTKLGADQNRQRYVDAQTSATRVEFEQPSPANAHLRFAAFGTGIQFSVDNGVTWSDARRQPAATDRTDRFRSYWTPIAAGVSAVQFRGTGNFFVRDIAMWAK